MGSRVSVVSWGLRCVWVCWGAVPALGWLGVCVGAVDNCASVKPERTLQTVWQHFSFLKDTLEYKGRHNPSFYEVLEFPAECRNHSGLQSA